MIFPPQAIYWVGDIDYIQHDYHGAITRFRRTDQEISQVAAAVPTVC